MPMRIASLVPSSTEMLFALGLDEEVVAVTHECDHPAEAAQLPHLTRSVIPSGLPPAEIDARVRELTGRGDALYELDEETLRGLEVDLIVTQALCDVCAVSFDDVRAVAERLPTAPVVVSLDPSTLGDVLADVRMLARATGVEERGERLHAALERRLAAVRAAVAGAERRPRVLALEWLDPPFIGGHWVPEMIALAGGEDPVGTAGVDSVTTRWGALVALRPEIVVVMPCGLSAAESAEQAADHAGLLSRLRADEVWAVDAAATFSRPGPRLVEGVELLAHLLHPDRADPPSGLEFSRVEVEVAV
ncbi:MAG: ABC transporter substrate-binding protein [Solirubrobacterales bacterium]